MTQSIVSRMSAIEGSLAKVNKLEHTGAGKIRYSRFFVGIVGRYSSRMDLLPGASALVPPTPNKLHQIQSTSQLLPPKPVLQLLSSTTTFPKRQPLKYLPPALMVLDP